MVELKKILNTLTPLFQEYQRQRSDLDKYIIKHGTVPLSICNICPRKTIQKIEKFNDNSHQLSSNLLKWMRRKDVKKLSSDGQNISFQSTKKSVEKVKGTMCFSYLGIIRSEKLYEYKLPLSKLKDKDFFPLLVSPFQSITFCSHLNENNIMDQAYPVNITILNKGDEMGRLNISEIYPRRVEELWTEKSSILNKLKLLCEECYSRIDEMGCEKSIIKRGLVYDHHCPLKEIIFKKLLDKYDIAFEKQEFKEYVPYTELFEYYLPELNTIVIRGYSDYSNIKNLVQMVMPDCLLIFGEKHVLLNYLDIGTNILIMDENGVGQIFVFEKDRKIETSIDKIIEVIMQKLEEYSDKERGKEHDKLINAFKRIGKEFGFIVQPELVKRGTRVDLVWLDRNGKIFVAIEVETTAQWRKDIISTWETEPELAIILTHYKTDKCIYDLIDYSLLKNMKHYLLMINYPLKKGYLLKGDEIVKTYKIGENQMQKFELTEI